MPIWMPVEQDFEDDVFSASDDDDSDVEDSVMKERSAKHAEYCARVKKSTTIAGTYVIDCPEIENGWDDVSDLQLSIASTPLAGFYQATFNFGIYEGVMMLSADRKALSYFSEEKLRDLETADEVAKADQKRSVNGHHERKDNDGISLGTKRKADDAEDHRPSKAAKTESAPESSASAPMTLYLCMRTCETGTGEIDPDPSMGRITFNDALTTFTGTADIGCVGRNVPLRGRKISDNVENQARWEDYGHAAAEAACSSRWH